MNSSGLAADSALRVVVLGAGVMGCAVAGELARRGCHVTVLEKAVPGAEASRAAAGILGAATEAEAPGALFDLCQFSLGLWPAFATALRARTGRLLGFQACGALQIAVSDSEVAGLRRKSAWLAAAGQRVEFSCAPLVQHLVQQFSFLAESVAAVAVFPGDGQVEPPLLADALAADAAACGARVIPQQTVVSIEAWGGAVRAVRTSDAVYPADAVVVAAGAWTDLLPDLANRRTTITPEHGQLVQLRLPKVLFREVVAWQGGYLVPRPDGRVVVGATTEQTGYAKQVTAGGLAQLLARATAIVPALQHAEVMHHWSGLRPRSADGLPLLGPHQGVAGLHFASGHHRNGILLTPATALLVAEGVLGQGFSHPLGAFLPG